MKSISDQGNLHAYHLTVRRNGPLIHPGLSSDFLTQERMRCT
jgi:hypothetical protein